MTHWSHKFFPKQKLTSPNNPITSGWEKDVFREQPYWFCLSLVFHVYMMYVCVLVFACAHGSLWPMSGVFLVCLPLYFLSQRLSVNPELIYTARIYVYWAPGICLPSSWVLGLYADSCYACLLCACWRSKLMSSCLLTTYTVNWNLPSFHPVLISWSTTFEQASCTQSPYSVLL